MINKNFRYYLVVEVAETNRAKLIEIACSMPFGINVMKVWLSCFNNQPSLKKL